MLSLTSHNNLYKWAIREAKSNFICDGYVLSLPSTRFSPFWETSKLVSLFLHSNIAPLWTIHCSSTGETTAAELAISHWPYQ